MSTFVPLWSAHVIPHPMIYGHTGQGASVPMGAMAAVAGRRVGP